MDEQGTVEAMCRAAYAVGGDTHVPWEKLPEGTKGWWRARMRAALAALS